MTKNEFLSHLYKGGPKTAYQIFLHIDDLWEDNAYSSSQIKALMNEIEVERLDTYAAIAILSALNATHIEDPIQERIYNHIHLLAPDRADNLLKGFKCFRTKSST